MTVTRESKKFIWEYRDQATMQEHLHLRWMMSRSLEAAFVLFCVPLVVGTVFGFIDWLSKSPPPVLVGSLIMGGFPLVYALFIIGPKLTKLEQTDDVRCIPKNEP